MCGPPSARRSRNVDETIDLGRVGFRTIDLDRGADGHGFGLIVNGAPIFCRGVCWTPLDLAGLSADRGRVSRRARAVARCRREHGSHRRNDDLRDRCFHELCDELGILVWQDFMFASMDYPWEDEAFVRAVALEATQALEALQSRPSLAVVCGSSEVDQQAAMLGLPPGGGPTSRRRAPARSRAGSRARSGLAADDPDRRRVPVSGRRRCQPLLRCRRVSAAVRGCAPGRRAVRRRVPGVLQCAGRRDRGPRSERGGDARRHPRWKARVPARRRRRLGLRGRPRSLRRAALRRPRIRSCASATPSAISRSAGSRPAKPCCGRLPSGAGQVRRAAAVWCGSPAISGLGAGWGIIDATGRPKAAYWYLKRALAPVALLSVDEGLNGLWLHAVNDTPAPSTRTCVSRCIATGHARRRRRQRLDPCPRPCRSTPTPLRRVPRSHVRLPIRPSAARRRRVDAARSRDRRAGRSRYYFPAHCRPGSGELGLTAHAEETDEGYALVLETERFAHAVAIDVEGFLPDDNYLHVEPGETRASDCARPHRRGPSRQRVGAEWRRPFGGLGEDVNAG